MNSLINIFHLQRGFLYEAEEQRGTEHRALPMRADFKERGRTELIVKSTMGSTKGLWERATQARKLSQKRGMKTTEIGFAEGQVLVN